jgi:hypothetical protein
VSVAEEWCVWLCAARSCPPAEICKFRTVETAGRCVVVNCFIVKALIRGDFVRNFGNSR